MTERFGGNGIYILDEPEAAIYQCSSEGVVPMEYEKTEHYQVTRDFLLNRQRMLNILFEE